MNVIKKSISILVAMVLMLSLSIGVFADANIYKVQSGDVLWKIAASNQTTWKNLAQINNIKNPHLIFPGQEIVLSKKLSNGEKVVSLLESIETGDMAPIAYINPDKYIQHNLSAKDGLAGFGELLGMLPKGSAKVNVVRVIEDGDFVVTHTEYDFFGPKVGIDMFRFENGLIVEHWDNLSEITPANPSGHTQFDGPTKITSKGLTEKNKALVTSFLNTVLVEEKYDQMQSFFDGDNYIQHNSNIADGLSGLNAAIGGLAEQGVFMKYDKVHYVIGEGNFVLGVSEGSFGGAPFAFYDIFRVENNKIAEHWDVMAPIPAVEDRMNDNGKF